MRQFKEEAKKALQKKTIIKALIAPVIAALLFGYLFSNGQVFNTPVTVIDLDNSMYSRELINKLDVSPYVAVGRVLNEAIEPNELLMNDFTYAVIVLPAGLEENRYRGLTSNIGFVVNDSVAAAVGNLRQGVSEVFAVENASGLMMKLIGMGMNSEQAAGVANGLAVQQRSLYNPTSATINTTIIGFVNLIILAFFMMNTIKIIPELRQSGQFDEDVKSPLALFSRVLPYVLLFFVSTYFILGLLKQFSGLRFGGSIFALAVPLFLYLLSSGLLAMLLSFHVSDPKKTSSKLALIVSPSFLLSNILLPVALMPSLIQTLAMALPLNWYIKCYQAIALRGAPLSVLGQEIGGLLMLIGIFSLFLIINITKAKRVEPFEETS